MGVGESISPKYLFSASEVPPYPVPGLSLKCLSLSSFGIAFRHSSANTLSPPCESGRCSLGVDVCPLLSPKVLSHFVGFVEGPRSVQVFPHCGAKEATCRLISASAPRYMLR